MPLKGVKISEQNPRTNISKVCKKIWKFMNMWIYMKDINILRKVSFKSPIVKTVKTEKVLNE